MLYYDRKEAGNSLGNALIPKIKDDKNIVILGIPRGGAVVAAKVAEMLEVPLGLIIPRKIGAPFNPEMAIGAVTQDSTLSLNEGLMEAFNISYSSLIPIIAYEIKEISRRLKAYGQDGQMDFSEKTVVVVDDGIATGFTVKAALKSIKKHDPYRLVLAVPVAPREVLAMLEPEVDLLVCPNTPDPFFAVGQFYEVFDQTEDKEVIELLENNRKYAGNTMM